MIYFNKHGLHAFVSVDLAHKFLQVPVNILENKQQFFIRVDNLFELYNIWMIKFLQYRNFPNGSTGNSLLLTL